MMTGEIASPAGKWLPGLGIRLTLNSRQSFAYDVYIAEPESLWISYGRPLHLSVGVAGLSRRTGGREMISEFDSHDWRDRKLQEWLLLLLRYAVTRESSDRSAALAMADELDSLGARWRPAGRQ
jgi:hypothetical protein